MRSRVRFWCGQFLGKHEAPRSPVVTTILNLLNASRWRAAAHTPLFLLGHSIGEVAAACETGMLTSEGALLTAHGLGRVASDCHGAMAHAVLTRAEVDAWSDEALCIAAVNGVARLTQVEVRDAAHELLSVTICGAVERVDGWLDAHVGAGKLVPPHPWHHPQYNVTESMRDGRALTVLPQSRVPRAGTAVFVSATTGMPRVERLDASYWREWLT